MPARRMLSSAAAATRSLRCHASGTEKSSDAARERVLAEHDVLDHREVRHQPDVLKRSRQSGAHARTRRQILDRLDRQAGCCRCRCSCTPEIRLNSVVLPAPFGPISAMRAPDGTSNSISFGNGEAAEPLGDAV